MNSSDVLEFWFGALGSPESGSLRAFWFTKSDATDSLIRERFGSTVEAALQARLDNWSLTLSGALALIIVLDQFTRNIYRDTPRGFAGDPAALQIAERLVDSGQDQTLTLLERWFIYMPFEHAESVEHQRRSVRLFEQLARDGQGEPLEWARRHAAVIERFGRFPHRNEVLERTSTPEEESFLRHAGSRF